MTYSDLFLKKERKISIIFLLPLLVSFIFFINFFLNKTSLPTRALTNFPRQIKVITPTANKAIIFWETASKEVNYLLFGENENKINQIIFDDRDSQAIKTKRHFHVVTINNLKSEEDYYFRIVTEKKIFNDLNGKPFLLKTHPDLGKIFTSSPLYGKVIDEKTHGLSEAILIFYSEEKPLTITTSKSNGDWLVVLMRLNKAFDKQEKITLEIYSEEKKKSIVNGKISDFSPLAFPIVIGKNYDLTINEDNVLSTSVTNKKINDFFITYPKDNAVIPGTRPLIKGFALPNSEVNVIIKSKSIYSFKTKANKDGLWQIDNISNLLPGNYQLEATTTDINGNNLKRQINFKIIKSGEQVLGEATPSATLIPTPTNTPTSYPSPTREIPPSISPTIYQTGNLNSYLYGFLALVFVIIGFFLILAY